VSTVTITARGEAPPLAWWGMVGVIATESALFAVLVATYFYLRAHAANGWPPTGIEKPEVLLPVIATAALIPSSALLAAATGANLGRVRPLLGVTLVLGAVFLAFQAWVIHSALGDFKPQDDAYGSIFYTLSGLHWVHVAAGMALAAWALGRTWVGHAPGTALAVTALYWHFTNAVALVLLLTVSLSPHL
jgi:heme/copper-type cytochrome/quinol oxidase subunit 3